MRVATLVTSLLVLLACQRQEPYTGIEIRMQPGDMATESLRWSPKGEKIALQVEDHGLSASLFLGPEEAPPVGLILAKSSHSSHYDMLYMDLNRNGQFGEQADTLIRVNPREVRGKIWSSFWGFVPVEFAESDGSSTHYPYPLSLWYVEDPLESDAEPVLRFSRRGWLEGTFDTEQGKARVLITESEMNGRFNRSDSWALSFDSAYSDLFTAGSARTMDMHQWLGEQAYGVDSIWESGLIIRIRPVDPHITRAEEARQNDWLAPDRNARRSGDTLRFLHDYDYALELAGQRKQHLLIDFETTWCGPCKLMDQWVYTADLVLQAASQTVCVKIDGDQSRKLVEKFGVSAYPTLILIDPEGNEVRRATGYQSVEKMIALLAR